MLEVGQTVRSGGEKQVNDWRVVVGIEEKIYCGFDAKSWHSEYTIQAISQ